MNDNNLKNSYQIPPELLSQLITNQQESQQLEDEIDLFVLWKAIWAGKWIIIVITSLFIIASVFYALSLT